MVNARVVVHVALVAGAFGVVAGRPCAHLIVDVLADRGEDGPAFAPADSMIPLVAALGMGVLIAQLAVFAAARRAGRIAPADALREVAIEHRGLDSSASSPACSPRP